jgi:hypothetical protein
MGTIRDKQNVMAMLETKLDELLSDKAKYERACIDAACCGTTTDYRKMHSTEETFEQTRIDYLALLQEVIP